jgi:molecular chaperone HtpG
MSVETHKETLGFQAEVSQLLNLMIHSLYSNKEIFLRELISNASDAIDRLRFAMQSDESLHENDAELEIHVSYDQAARTITVRDNGIGMARDEVVQQIGTIAKSGTREFLQSLTGDQQRDANLIGQFGVGFYSAFVVADRVTLATRKAGLAASEGARWESAGAGEYTLETVEKATRGTEVTLHLREGEDELLSGYRLRSIIRKYSDHITVPILMPVENTDEEKAEQTVQEERVNQASALWVRSRNQIPHEEYVEFYKYLAYDSQEPLTYLHSRMEGKQEYILLLYIPATAPFDLWNRERRHGVKLYVRRVFIMDGAEELIPGYMRFLRGVIDSNDLPLNVSREILQQNKLIEAIRSNTVKKVLSLLSDLAKNEPEKYATFWKTFGGVLKEGMIEDFGNQEALAKLFRFSTTLSSSDTQDVSLETYAERMKEGQDKIYFINAESYAAAKDSPLLEIFTQKGVEVLILSDPRVDYFFGGELHEFNKIPLQSVSHGEIDLSKIATSEDAEQKPAETQEQASADEIQKLLDRLKNALKDEVKEVRVTTRLTTSPACLVVGERDLDPQFLRMLKAAGQTVPTSKPILEINAQHAIMRKILREENEQRFAAWASILYDQSVLSLGEQLENPARFVNRLNGLLSQLS